MLIVSVFDHPQEIFLQVLQWLQSQFTHCSIEYIDEIDFFFEDVDSVLFVDSFQVWLENP